MAPRPIHRFATRVRATVQADSAGLHQSFAALLVSSGGDLIAGLTLGANTNTHEDMPGLLVLVPAAIGMRGNIFGALGSRLGTAIHTGTYRFSSRRDTVTGQNIIASIILSLFVSMALAVLAKSVAGLFGVSETISLVDFLVISILGGIVSSVVVLGFTLVVANMAVRRHWDLDNVAAPLVTAAGDMVTLPSLFLATFLVGISGVSVAIAVVLSIVAVVALVVGWRSGLPLVRRIVRESVPILLIAGLVDIIAGLTIEHRLESFLAFPALLVLIPPFLEDTGALGGILSSRLSSKLHLGIIEPVATPQRPARDDFALILILALPVFTLVAVSAEVASLLFGYASPGIVKMVGVSLIGGFIATVAALGIAYYSSIATYRLGLDPDNHGIPMLTSSMDLIGALALIMAIVVVGIA